ncbi:hypothetical protein CU098_004944, partial [Rhizopus stolonifer]
SPTIGSPTNSFTFGGSVSGSVPGSPASTSSFNFGATSVSFGDPSGASISSPAHSKSFNNSHGSPIASPLRRAQSESEFSITPSEGTNTGFNFGNLKQPSTLTTQTSAGSLSTFTFNTPATTTPSSFSFGQPSGSGAPFNNTTTTTSTTATPAPSFTFGTKTPATTSTTHKTPSPAFTFGSATTPSTTTPTSTTPTSTTPTSITPTSITPSFGFSKPSNLTTTSTETKPTDSKPTPSFTFGAPASSTPTSTATPTLGSGFSIGTTKPAEAPKTPAFTFGTDKDKIPKFVFGTSTDDKAKDDKTTAGSTITSSPFTFVTYSSTSAPASTSSAVTPAPPKVNVFSFEKILQDLAKTAAQPPNQVYALVTPALSGLQQNQVVHHTNFRIDNISLSTRFHELPEQAQKELDAMQEYIRRESQRCEYIANQKFPQHLNAMSKTKKDTELLSQQIDALLNTLKSEMGAVETFYDNVKDQLRHANDGCAVLEACKHPGHTARWLFGYSEDDDYFSQLTKKLSGKLEEYKRCIWEIERTAESWSQNKVQSPQDIAHIMRAQNQAFLALSSKVAALHESVNREKNYFQQYLRMCH